MEDAPGRYRSVEPAWNDANLRDLARHIESPLFLAHIRAAVGSPVQQTNCHPFRHGRWLFVHNGLLHGFHEMRRDLMLAIEPSLFDAIGGSADSEVLFYLALTFGLEENPTQAVERAVRFVEATGERHGIELPVQMTLGFSDGERLWGVRYSTEHSSRSLFVSQDVSGLRKLHPDNPQLQRLSEPTAQSSRSRSGTYFGAGGVHPPRDLEPGPSGRARAVGRPERQEGDAQGLTR